MKDRFPEFYNELDFEELWSRCTFVFDTNILINLYGFPKEDYTQFLSILESISDRLWMPHQIGWEYQKNRYIGINKAINSHNALKSSVKDLNQSLKRIKNSITELQLDCVDIDLVNESLEEINSNIEKMSSGINDFDFDFDKIRDELDSLYEGKVGAEYPSSRLKELYKEAEYRYASKTPPGFKDKNKKDSNPYGDFVLWNQMIDYARDNTKSIIFITEDSKEDWWLNKKPHPYLIKEFLSTKQGFYMYNFGDFLTQSKTYLNANIQQETINKVKDTEKLRDLTDKLQRSDESQISNVDQMAIAFEALAKEPELFRKMIKPGYTLTPEDNRSLLNLMVKEPELFKRILISSGHNFTENDQFMLDILSKQPGLISIMADELDLVNIINENKDSEPIKEKPTKKLPRSKSNKSDKNKKS